MIGWDSSFKRFVATADNMIDNAARNKNIIQLARTTEVSSDIVVMTIIKCMYIA